MLLCYISNNFRKNFLQKTIMIIALDYGTKRVGLAISDDTERIAVASKPIIYNSVTDLMSAVEVINNQYEPKLVVLGIPLGLEGKPTQMSEKIREFANQLKTELNLEVVLWNEVMTSIAAGQFVKKDKSGKLDSESARIILQEYLDFKNQ